MPKSKVVLKALEFHAHHGAFATEGVLGGRFVVDAELVYSFAEMGDDLGEAVNYAAAYTVIRTVVEGERVQLIEVLANRLARRLLAEFGRLDEVTVRVHKPFAPLPGIFGDVYAELTLGRGE